MKFYVSVFVFLICIVYSHQLWEFKDCPSNHPAFDRKNELACGVMTCMPDGKTFGKGCGTYACVITKGYIDEDPKKPYPECCGGPICDDKDGVYESVTLKAGLKANKSKLD